jgi:ribosomal protein L37E
MGRAVRCLALEGVGPVYGDGGANRQTITCPDCGSPVQADRARLCPTCGYPLVLDGTTYGTPPPPRPAPPPAPAQSYGPTPSYGAVPTYGAPTPSYGAPTPAYGAPQAYGAPAPVDPVPQPAAPATPPSGFLRQPTDVAPVRRRPVTKERHWDPDTTTAEPAQPQQTYARPPDHTLGPYCPSCGHRSAVGRVRCEVCGAELWPGAAAPPRRGQVQTAGVQRSPRRRTGLLIAALVAVPLVAIAALYVLAYAFG